MKAETIAEKRGKLARNALQLNARSRALDLPYLMLMTDDRLSADWVAAAGSLPAGAAVIVRHRDDTKRELLARTLSPVCVSRRVMLVIADDLKLAMRMRADGVHVPQARHKLITEARLRNPNWIVTASAHDHMSVAAASRAGADAAVVSPLFETRSHPGERALGVTRFQSLVRCSRIPAYALGGINADNVERLRDVSIAGIAMINGWFDGG
ncbi:MAG: thiamine phosphate synthase [Micropepsaceae bacterium]